MIKLAITFVFFLAMRPVVKVWQLKFQKEEEEEEKWKYF